MSMHLVGPWMSTTNTKKRKQNKSKRQLQADSDHDKWLRKMGINSDQRSVAQPGSVSGLGPEGRKFESYHSDQIPLSNKIVHIKSNKMVDTETKLLYSSRYVVGQAYNKGGIQVLSRNETKDPSTGKRR
jgi:hypothetical protein